MSKVTDALIELTELAKNRQDSYLSQLEILKTKHLQTVEELLNFESVSHSSSGMQSATSAHTSSASVSQAALASQASNATQLNKVSQSEVESLKTDLKNKITSDFEDIKEILRGLWLIQSASMQAVELVSGYGEIWSAQILNAYLKSKTKNSVWLDARKVLIVDSFETSAVVNAVGRKSEAKRFA
jgi:aspartokinase